MIKEKLVTKITDLYENTHSVFSFDDTSYICLVPENTYLKYKTHSDIVMKSEIIIGFCEGEARINIIRCNKGDEESIWSNLFC